MSSSFTLSAGDSAGHSAGAVAAAEDSDESTDDAVDVAGEADLLPPPPRSLFRKRISFLSAHFRHFRHFFFLPTLRCGCRRSGPGGSGSSPLFLLAFLFLFLLLRIRSILDSPQMTSTLSLPRPRFWNCVARLSS